MGEWLWLGRTCRKGRLAPDDRGRCPSPASAGSPERSQGRAWRCRRTEFGGESGLLESRWVEAVARYPTLHSSGEAWFGENSAGGDLPIGARGAAPKRGSTTARLSGGRGKGSTGLTAQQLPEEGAESRGAEGRCLLPFCPQCRGRTLFPWSTFSPLRGEGEAACWKAP